MKNYTIAILLATNLATASYYEVADAPLPIGSQVRYEKVDDTRFNMITTTVFQETVSVDDIPAIIQMAEDKIVEFSGEPEEAARLEYAQNLKATKMAELETLKNLGVTKAADILTELQK
jgi:hypothetical protein